MGISDRWGGEKWLRKEKKSVVEKLCRAYLLTCLFERLERAWLRLQLVHSPHHAASRGSWVAEFVINLCITSGTEQDEEVVAKIGGLGWNHIGFFQTHSHHYDVETSRRPKRKFYHSPFGKTCDAAPSGCITIYKDCNGIFVMSHRIEYKMNYNFWAHAPLKKWLQVFVIHEAASMVLACFFMTSRLFYRKHM